MEELVLKWVDLDINVLARKQRQQTLIVHGYDDILDQLQEIEFILDAYSHPSNNLALTRMQIGGSEPLRVLKLFFKAIKPSDLANTQIST